MSKIEKSEKVYIMAGEKFTDLHSNLSSMDFVEAGHLPIAIAFSDKSKHTEGKAKNNTLSIGYVLDKKGKKEAPTFRNRLQNKNVISIYRRNLIYLDKKKDISVIFNELSEKYPDHFNAEDPIYIRELITLHIDSGWQCKWRKIRIGHKIYRLMLDEVRESKNSDWKASSEFDLDTLQEISEGMLDDLCYPTKIFPYSMNVCSMVHE